MKLKSRADWIALLVCVLIVGAIFYYVWWNLFRKRPEARLELRQVFRQISLGDSPAQVRNHFASNRPKTLKLRTNDPSLWSINTPLEFGAKNWMLYLEWSGGQLVAKRMRTPDGIHIRPRDKAPDDEVRSGWKSPLDFRPKPPVRLFK